MTTDTALAESARRIAGEINDSLASALGLAAIAWYFEELRAVLAHRSREEADTSPARIPSKAETVASVETVARMAAAIPGGRLTDAHKATEIALLQSMLDRGLPVIPAVRISRVTGEHATALITSAWLPAGGRGS